MKKNSLHDCWFRGLARYWVLIMLVCVALASSSALAADLLDDASYEDESIDMAADPIEPVNRAFFVFNDKFYLWVVDPVATGYSKVLPEDIRGCVGNFFYNLEEPVRAVNCLLQGRLLDTGRALSRFVLNSIFGVFGLADPAGHEFAIAPVYATFGQTLAVWGIGDGFYLVVPFYGPSTVRDLTGFVVDSVAGTTYYPWRNEDVPPMSLTAGEFVNSASLHLGEYQELKSLSFDPYVAFRNGYFQMRTKKRNQHRIRADK